MRFAVNARIDGCHGEFGRLKSQQLFTLKESMFQLVHE
jgi:hypothetical protein